MALARDRSAQGMAGAQDDFPDFFAEFSYSVAYNKEERLVCKRATRMVN